MNQSTREPSKGKRKNGTGLNARTGRIMLYILLGLALCIGAFMISIYPTIITKSEQEANIKVPSNATPQMVRDTLTKYFGEKYATSVLRLAKLRNIDISNRHGAYTIPAGTNVLNTMRKLTSGAQTPVRITINGFRDMPKMINLVSRKMEFPEDSLRAVLSDSLFLSQYDLTPANAMALFMDNTYETYWTSSARELVTKIGESYNYYWNDERKALASGLGLTPAEIMIVASIVDEETNNEGEKATIGRLYINRLHNNMKLQADPTVRFALGDFTVQRILHKDLTVESPYNTYRHHGLPPGPIRTTSETTVSHILNSEPNNYLYMCAREDFSGRHNFASTYQEHLENALRYQARLDERDITR